MKSSAPVPSPLGGERARERGASEPPPVLQTETPNPVVLTPDLILAGLFHPSAREVLHAWRDGKITPVLNRALTLSCLRSLRKAGVNQHLLKHWATWFNQTEIAESGSTTQSITSLCNALALTQSGCQVICFRPPNLPEIENHRWITAENWLAATKAAAHPH